MIMTKEEAFLKAQGSFFDLLALVEKARGPRPCSAFPTSMGGVTITNVGTEGESHPIQMLKTTWFKILDLLFRFCLDVVF